MTLAANLIGLAAVAMFVLSYQRKTRRGIIFFNAGSRILYIAQYVLLGAYAGVALDLAGFLVSLLAQGKDKGWRKHHPGLTVLAGNLLIIAMGLAVWQGPVSLLPIVGVMLETGALWKSEERTIRILSLFAAPFWLAYNLIFSAYGSAAGNVLTLLSIGIALVRYDRKKAGR